MRRVELTFAIFLIFLIQIHCLAQDKRFTRGAENGYMWIDFEKYSIMRDMKYDYLSSMLERQRIINLFQLQPDSLGCREDIKILLETNKQNQIDLNVMVKQIDKFYSDENLRIIPIVFAYCYCVKEIAGRSKEELAEYLIRIIHFSESEQ